MNHLNRLMKEIKLLVNSRVSKMISLLKSKMAVIKKISPQIRVKTKIKIQIIQKIMR